MHAMYEREEAYLLRVKVQIDDAYLGGERNGGKAEWGSKTKIPIAAAASLDDAGDPVHVQLSMVRTFAYAAIADSTQVALAKGCQVISDGLACFSSVAEVGSFHQPVIAKRRHPNKLPEFR